MGTNKRHGSAIARAKANSRAEASALIPTSLGPDELGDAPVVQARGVIPVRAFVPFGSTTVQIEGVAVAWTADGRATCVKWPTDTDAKTCWLWSGAVRKIDP